jgi:hypothetical protein
MNHFITRPKVVDAVYATVLPALQGRLPQYRLSESPLPQVSTGANRPIGETGLAELVAPKPPAGSVRGSELTTSHRRAHIGRE